MIQSQALFLFQFVGCFTVHKICKFIGIKYFMNPFSTTARSALLNYYKCIFKPSQFIYYKGNHEET